jgi:hypothetical protein
MNHPVRAFLFRHYPWLILAVLAVALPAVAYLSKPDNITANVATVLGGAAGVVFFVQKQKIEELQIFERLFTTFNQRYATLNEGLQAIVAGTASDDARSRDCLNDYFNLCAEEYLFYREGRILPDVWAAWCRGMLFYLQCPRIRTQWDTEAATGSHYGLTFEVIEAGARHPNR